LHELEEKEEEKLLKKVEEMSTDTGEQLLIE
jgi:hypothetical protein